MELALVRQHLRLDDDAADDDLLLQYIAAARAHIEMHCDRKIVEGVPMLPEEMAMTPDVEQALLTLVGHWYANREAVVTGTISTDLQLSFERLLWYRKRF